jgi:hypothetical protein
MLDIIRSEALEGTDIYKFLFESTGDAFNKPKLLEMSNTSAMTDIGSIHLRGHIFGLTTSDNDPTVLGTDKL